MMFELIEVVSCRLICPKSWNRIVVIFEAQIVQSVTEHDWFGLLAVEISFKKWNKWWMSGLPQIAHMLCFRTVPGLCELDQNRPYVVCLNC